MSATRPRPGNPHDWIDLDRFLTIQDETLRRLAAYVIDSYDLQPTQEGKFLRLHGSISCCDGTIKLYVDTLFDVDERFQVRGTGYRYHAELVGPPQRPILRYDNSHTYLREGHPDAFHKHSWNHRT